MTELLSWLRATINAELEVAKAADEVAPGPWVNTGQDGDGDAWQVHGAPTGETEWNYELEGEVPVLLRVATLNYDDGGGVWEREAADHIVLQQPRDTIARCEAELALIARCEGPDEPGTTPDFWWGMREAIDMLVVGYRHRPGFKPEWGE
ncbi:DUF6221 family protein [Nonomuraea rubra]|uniref:Uncharacterized protein n=1 Tax=Nonomuraea rubra TaxID=46180 RepID=A0A7X0P6J0_9ACTN|nr:DUF6221 family protein [Nonomuraea rubra]MBB6556179.1 hypothetical protein [Nonomuraea rubra]